MLSHSSTGPAVVTRRTALRRAGSLTLGASAVGALMTSTAQAAAADGRLSTVTTGGSTTVQVDAAPDIYALEGFPAGWTAIDGDRVVIAQSLVGPGKTAQPVCHWRAAQIAPSALEPGTSVAGVGSPELQASTVRDPLLAVKQRNGDQQVQPVLIAIVDNVDPSAVQRVIAVHQV